MAEIVLCRIDSRLIHGQVVTKWVNQAGANRIIVISDMLASDPFMKNVYLMAAPPNVKVDCYGINEACEEWKSDKFGLGNVLILFGDLKSLKLAWEKGFSVERIQVGGLGGGPNRKTVFQNITLDDADVKRLEELDGKNVEIYFQTIPEDKPQPLKDILKKYK
ncbi:PTS system mannose/fructose/N-acetylgalactosamine-transporter subunit IIB [Abyssisolibacter fermentans]|uniref:PTS system mannose/fructose/N-acetylgalactosamine-transporter subunit IIB n=1 Tax=Abyssisolibacter fermentans TaxID=1766203 RepID=UPI00082BAF41|nr:PTS sugar transporter subunit IIB [Abyssisolibacter fermentans]